MVIIRLWHIISGHYCINDSGIFGHQCLPCGRNNVTGLNTTWRDCYVFPSDHLGNEHFHQAMFIIHVHV